MTYCSLQHMILRGDEIRCVISSLHCLYIAFMLKIDLEGWRKGVSALANFYLGFEVFGQSQVHDLGLDNTKPSPCFKAAKGIFIPVWAIQSCEINFYLVLGFCDCLYESQLWCLEYFSILPL